MKITYVYADNPTEFNTSRFMAINPAKAVNSIAGNEAYLLHISEFEKDSDLSKFVCNKSDIIVIERNFFGLALPHMVKWKIHNKFIIGVFDDAYAHMTVDNASYDYWINSKVKYKNDKNEEIEAIITPHVLNQFRLGCKIVDCIMTPSIQLCKDYKTLANTHYFENLFDSKYYNLPKKEFNPKEIIIGWGGSLSHFNSFDKSGVLEALKNVCKSCSNVKIKICGDKRVFDLIDIPEEQKLFEGFVSYENWAKTVSTFDIGIAPLSGEYDKRRSWIKPMEYMMLKIPFIASDNVSYDSIKQYGKVIRNSPTTWEEAILDTISNLTKNTPSLKETLGKAFNFSTQQDIYYKADSIVKTYKELAKKYGGLDL